MSLVGVVLNGIVLGSYNIHAPNTLKYSERTKFLEWVSSCDMPCFLSPGLTKVSVNVVPRTSHLSLLVIESNSPSPKRA